MNTKKSPKSGKAKQEKPNYHHGDLARALVLAGRAILLEQGTDALSLRAVAAKVGVSQAAPYSHFSNKKSLLRAISASGFAELADSMLESVSLNTDLRDTFLNYAVAYIEFAINNPDIYRLMFASIDPNARKTQKREENRGPDILGIEANRAYQVLYHLCKTQSESDQQATNYAHSTWGLVHGLASLLNEGLISMPQSNRKKHLRRLLSSQMQFPQ